MCAFLHKNLPLLLYRYRVLSSLLFDKSKQKTSTSKVATAESSKQEQQTTPYTHRYHRSSIRKKSNGTSRRFCTEAEPREGGSPCRTTCAIDSAAAAEELRANCPRVCGRFMDLEVSCCCCSLKCLGLGATNLTIKKRRKKVVFPVYEGRRRRRRRRGIDFDN